MRTLFLLLATQSFSMPLWAADLRAYTEEFPPFNYTEKMQPKGYANAVLAEITAQSGLKIERLVFPWPRAVASNQNDDNSLLFTTMRTPEREKKYRWVGPIDGCDLVAIKLKNRKDIQISNAKDLNQYAIAFAKGSANEEVLKKMGVSGSKLVAMSSTSNTVSMLYAKRVDLITGVYLAHAFIAQQNQHDAAQLEIAYELEKGFGCYFAFNPKVNEQLFRRFDAAFNKLQKSGELQKLKQELIRSD